MKVPISDVPMRLRRTAMRHLDSMRDSEIRGSSSRDTEFGAEAWPIYRPDLSDVAYWELELLSTDEDGNKGGSKGGRQPTTSSNGQAARGFVIVATGDHDFPIPHWSLERPPVSYQLEQEAAKTGKVIARIYRLDALAYLAEDDQGNEIARSGQSPALPEGVSIRTEGIEVSSLIARPKSKGDDAQADKLDFALERKGPKDPDLKLVDPKEWRNLKKEYRGRYEPFLDEVRKRAANAWKVDRDVEEFGEGLMAGDTFDVRMLERNGKVEVTGKGKKDVTVEVDDKRRGPPLVRGKSNKGQHKEELDFELRLTYESGEDETLRYFIVSPDTPSNAKGNREKGGSTS
jgi:hypothetical protein